MRRIAFVDRDGTLIAEPPDFQIDAYDKIRFVPGMLAGLQALQAAGFELVMVSNQDGLGTASFPQETFDGPHALLMQLLESQGVRFAEVLIDPSLPEEKSPNRKPGVGMLMHYLRDRNVDLAGSVVIGDRDTDLELARNLGARGYKIGEGQWDWPGLVRDILGRPRRAVVERNTRETRIRVEVDLDAKADPIAATGLGFFDHMLEQLGKHGGFALSLTCAGDTHIDEHHTIEDSALALGQALRQAIGDKRGIGRYGSAAEGESAADAVDLVLPMDETLVRASLDFSGRPYFVFDGEFPRERVGDLPTELVPHFFRSLCETAGLNLHLQVRGDNAHHMVEACFKATARALRQSVARSGSELPSTKGAL
ncbi:bifunctional histidinol-phosphatase/imidazoleglycerol-phosphate dehydratase HisB [Pseudomarimonas salicorniae]|uniref:Histidine biosynthesis bifunctional protein HisB n=1 Tax=Pseudomarimonas salicorniae TaxID=2933270 RepID=A0ABT0GLI3_9GAMM|nr:bifunctional histidinol-phosphatase/imidazoleglycerol-phosphate dehydratase HisB [Lysobacter sp. CAU 1642]MCK7595402.1 bifunctional histidinol-phosphatase/imidazoleglycerol-phosphate dehydratase HisB [Lysobacter sp. CAU 1642]